MFSLIHGAAFLAALWALNVHADQWVPAQPFEKAFYNGLIRVSVRLPLTEGARPTAAVTKKEKSGPVKLCSGDLANEKRPVEVVASRDGKTLVTVDEWGRAGYEHALVFYRCDKALVLKKDHGLDDFLSLSEIEKYASMSMSSRDWSRNVELKMEKDAFVVKLKSGRAVRFSLLDGTLKK